MEDDSSAAGDLESHNGSDSVGGDSASFAVVKQEVRMMNVVRTFVFALLMTMGTIAADVLFVVVQIREENASKEDFATFAHQLMDEFHASLHQKMVVADSLATSLALEAQSLKLTWPYVSFTEFDLRCTSARELSQAASITYLPRVDNQTRNEWENYAGYIDAQQDAMDQSTLPEKETPEHPTAFYVDSNRSVQDGIYYLEESQPFTLGPVAPGISIFPTWQRAGTANIQEEIRMFDHASNKIRSPALTAVVQQRVPAQMGVLSDFLYHDTSDYVFYTTPRAALFYPIYATTSRDQVVAVLDFEFPWESFWEDVLDEETAALVVVVESSCGRQFTFQVNGDDVVYVGEGDHHVDPKTFDGSDPIASTFANYSGSFLAGIDINGTTTSAKPSPCAFRIHVYMTEAFRQSYLTNAPMITRWIVLGVFCCTVGVFICYDCAVEARSNRVVETAKRTDALVSTLFPSSVKAQLLANAAAKRKAKIAKSKKAHKEWEYHQSRELPTTIEEGDEDQDLEPFVNSNPGQPVIRTPKNRLQNFLQPGDGIDGLLDIHDSEPIADLFPNASVMFADIAGEYIFCPNKICFHFDE
jgi:hypothetical protein